VFKFCYVRRKFFGNSTPSWCIALQQLQLVPAPIPPWPCASSHSVHFAGAGQAPAVCGFAC
jgi:hypothetical protein